MSHEFNFRSVLRREVDAIPLPAERVWVRPARRPRGVDPLIFGAVVAGLALAAAISTSVLRVQPPETGGALASPQVAPPARPTVIDGRSVAPLPNAYTNTRYGYILAVPAWLRRTTLPVGHEATAGLLYREIFSGRGETRPARVTAGDFTPWDLIVEVWRRDGATVETMAPTFGCGPQGVAPCELSTTYLRGTRTVLATLGPPVRGKVYMIERGEELLVLRYSVGSDDLRPEDVTEELLEQIVRGLGLP